MTEEIKHLIDKINQEGIQSAQDNARKIEKEARDQAARMLDEASKEARRFLDKAKEAIRLMEEKEKALLAQAGRDLLLTLRAQINQMLAQLIAEQVRAALTPKELAALITHFIKAQGAGHKQDIVVTLNKEDQRALEEHFLAGLKDEIAKGIVLKPSVDIKGGFTISFDAGKSQFDFSDRALAEYIGTYLKPKLSKILGSAQIE